MVDVRLDGCQYAAAFGAETKLPASPGKVAIGE
jgi:hypothetical protein